MGEGRLTDLALLNIHRNIPVLPEDVTNLFAHQKDRRVDLILL